ncbi:NAD-dependent epimerase/dehydratase family protein [Candidatus Woesearchaeota archaeon]|nr:NAD-dependent epimerase/dehydratase family protein [Candidatus Woesearchaeota archaeon]
MKEFSSIAVSENATLKEAMASIDNSGLGQALILGEKNKLLGIVSDGDIRRALMKGDPITLPVKSVMNKDIIVLEQKDLGNSAKVHGAINSLKNRLKTAKHIPIVDNGSLVEFAYIKALQQHGKIVSTIEKQSAKRVLIIGGAGYLGSVLSGKLLGRGYKVRVFDILYFGEKPVENLKQNQNFELARGDMRNIAEFNRALVGVDAVVLLAGIVGDPACKLSPEETVETNYLATKMVAEACKYHQINRFVFASSASVYGVMDGVVHESSPLNPVSLYARSKIMSEEAILSLIDENFSPTILRMGTLYGLSPRMRFDLAINIMSMKAATENSIKIFGGSQWRPFLHVDDAAEAYISVIEADLPKVKGEIFNAAAHNCRISELGSHIKNEFPDVNIETVKEDTDARDYRVSSAKIGNVLSFIPKKTIPDGIAEIRKALESGLILNPKDRIHYNS